MIILNQRLKKLKRKSINYLNGTILFLIFSIFCFCWAYYIKVNTKDTGATLHQMIYSGNKEEDEIVSLTVTGQPLVFAEYDNNITSPKYYFLMDRDYLYIGYLDYETFQKLNKEDIGDNPVTIKGVTKKIRNDVVELAINVYNENLGNDFLTKENYKSYIGEVCIDTVSGLVNNKVQIIIGILFIIISFNYLIIYFYRNLKFDKILKKQDVWDKVETELGKDDVLDYSKFGLYLTDNYIMDGLKIFTIIPYNDIVWIYFNRIKNRGMVSDRHLVVVTKDKKKIKIASLRGAFHVGVDNTYIEIIQKNI